LISSTCVVLLHRGARQFGFAVAQRLHQRAVRIDVAVERSAHQRDDAYAAQQHETCHARHAVGDEAQHRVVAGHGMRMHVLADEHGNSLKKTRNAVSVQAK
jgi:RNA-splicing ligase RtcB